MGIAVSLLMVITTLMATFVALHWKHHPILVYAINGALLKRSTSCSSPPRRRSCSTAAGFRFSSRASSPS